MASNQERVCKDFTFIKKCISEIYMNISWNSQIKIKEEKRKKLKYLY